MGIFLYMLLSVCLFYLGKLYKDLRVQFNAKQSSTSKFSLIRNIYYCLIRNVNLIEESVFLEEKYFDARRTPAI